VIRKRFKAFHAPLVGLIGSLLIITFILTYYYCLPLDTYSGHVASNAFYLRMTELAREANSATFSSGPPGRVSPFLFLTSGFLTWCFESWRVFSRKFLRSNLLNAREIILFEARSTGLSDLRSRSLFSISLYKELPYDPMTEIVFSYIIRREENKFRILNTLQESFTLHSSMRRENNLASTGRCRSRFSFLYKCVNYAYFIFISDGLNIMRSPSWFRDACACWILKMLEFLIFIKAQLLKNFKKK